jgi:XTP/dITP diphosphohydrolase
VIRGSPHTHSGRPPLEPRPAAAPPVRLLATRSGDKVREIRAVFGDTSLVSLAELAIEESAAESAIECFATFRENALAKARYFADLTGLPTLADDSGLVVDALDGAPGVRSKRFSDRPLAGTELDRANNRELLHRLTGVPPERRTARYVCAAACVAPAAHPLTAVGTCAGVILETPAGTAGFGYDPLFFLPVLGATFAEVPADVKNRQSHRARAFRALAAVLG